MFVEPLDPYKLRGVRVFDSSSFRMVLCFFNRFYVTVGDMHVLEFDSPQAYMEHMRVSLYDAVLFPPVMEGQETNPWRTLSRILCRLWRAVDGSLTLKPARSHAICDAWEENNCSTSSWSLTSVRKRTKL